MDFERLDVWKRSVQLSTSVYKEFSDCRDFGFKDQITRSSLSIPSNIAEGMERVSDRDKARFLSIAKGSCAELRTQVYIATDIGYLSKELGAAWKNETLIISRMLAALMKKMLSE